VSRTNYIVATDQLYITAINVSGSNVLISFTSQAGKYYRVLYTDNLINPVWITAADFLPGTGGIVQAVHLGGAMGSQRIYRVQLLNNAQLTPVAAFTASPTNGGAPLLVTFTDSSTGYITNRFWNFGDGTTTNTVLTTVSHTYAAPGSNTVSLTVFGPFGTNLISKPKLIVVTNSVYLPITITSFHKSPSNVVIQVQSYAGVSYQLESTPTLSNPSWAPMGPSTPGTGAIIQLLDNSPSGPARFYRVRQQ
jgi:PKD repeat protein